MGAATQAVTVTPQPNALPRTERISRKVKRAVDLMVMEGQHRADAAKKAGLAEHSLYVALRKPHVLAYRNTLLGVLRASAASRTIAKAEELMDKSESDHVKADMVKYLGALDQDVVPVKSGNGLNVNVNIPGLTIQYLAVGAPGDEPRVLSELAHQSGSHQQINGLPQRVPHPSEGNVLPAPNPPGNHEGQE